MGKALRVCQECGLVVNDPAQTTADCRGRGTPHDFVQYADGRYRAGWENGYATAESENETLAIERKKGKR